MRAYEVKLKTTNNAKDSVYTGREVGDTPYVSVEDGKAFVVTEDPSSIFEFFGKHNVLELKKLGVGYVTSPYEQFNRTKASDYFGL